MSSPPESLDYPASFVRLLLGLSLKLSAFRRSRTPCRPTQLSSEGADPTQANRAKWSRPWKSASGPGPNNLPFRQHLRKASGRVK